LNCHFSFSNFELVDGGWREYNLLAVEMYTDRGITAFGGLAGGFALSASFP
jgi:hypothetical protein